jgi:uncharacterized protein (TIGR02646 family)
MRYVDRSAVGAPASLSDADGAGPKELTKAQTYYGATPKPTTCYPFKSYKGEDVKAALRALFHGKCAYCESRFEGTQPPDIEHYRPKGGVMEKAAHPGYWWLAMAWSNLLPSCIDCNRRRGQSTARLGMTLAELEAELSANRNIDPGGKQDAFPTLDAIWADPEVDPDSFEKPALIDPTRTDPKAHLVWAGGDVPVVLPVADANGSECPRATASIFTYALNRLGLVQNRAETIQVLNAQLKTIRILATIAMDQPEPSRSETMAKVDDAITDLRRQAGSTKAYSALVETHVAAFEVELQTLLDRN